MLRDNLATLTNLVYSPGGNPHDSSRAWTDESFQIITEACVKFLGSLFQVPNGERVSYLSDTSYG